MYKIKKSGFTLAEVLITLLIIGVVASLTIPSLINDTNKAEYVTKLKKEQTVLNQAFKLIILDAGGSILNNPNFNSATGDAATEANAMNEFATKLNVVKNCGNSLDCWYTSSLKYLGGDVRTANLDANLSNNYGKAILADGSIIFLNIYNLNCTTTAGSAPSDSLLYNSVCGALAIDINGETGPNKMGRDYFEFWIAKTGIYPVGIFNDGYSCVINSSTYSTSDGCAAKVLTDGAMNY